MTKDIFHSQSRCTRMCAIMWLWLLFLWFVEALLVVESLLRSTTIPKRNIAFVVPTSTPNNRLALDVVSRRWHRNRVTSRFAWNENYFAENKNEDEEGEEDAENQPTQRKRDKLRDWVYGSNKEMVKRIGIDGNPIEPPPRVRANFADLFAGMPSMQDIIGGLADNDNENSEDTVKDSPSTYLRRKSQIDDSWFEDEKKLIMQNYDGILQDMLAKLERERMQNPESVPENAEAMIRTVLNQEMELEIKTTRDKRIDEMLKDYEKSKYAQMSELDDKLQVDESVQKLIEEGEEEFRQKEANRLEIEDFLRYEQEAVLRFSEDNVRAPIPGQDLDTWALERLREMADARADVDGQEMTLYNLEDNIEQLEKRMQKKEVSRSVIPESMKEWQMYRSIATNLERLAERTNSGEDERSREDKILQQLNSWKEYIDREEVIRKQSGLTRGPRLPFEWQEAEQSEPQMPNAKAVKAQGREAKIKVRKDLNRMSIEAMESLLEKTDPARRERLERELNYLKAELEKSDYLDIDESAIDEIVKVGPVDTTNLFRSYVSDEDDVEDDNEYEPPGATISPVEVSSKMFQTAPIGVVNPPLAPPDTPFFGDDYEKRKVPPPSTPFFADDQEYDMGETFTGDSKLGTMEDQKLEAMYRKANARTTEEREAIRSQWEAFREFEKKRREESGLSGDSSDSSDLLAGSNLKYSVSEVMREDGDFDADKILTSIGPRPKRKRSESAPLRDQTRADEGQIRNVDIDDAGDLSARLESDVNKDEVMDSLYRSIASIGGGRYKDDPDAAMKQKQSFIELLNAENEMRKALENETDQDFDRSIPSPEDDVRYAEEVLSTLGARPKPRRARIMDEGDFSDKGGILALNDDSYENEDEDSDEYEFVSKDDIGGVDLMPEWLRKENEEARSSSPWKRKTFLGSEIDEVFDDDKYEHNMRQLAEYERRRAGSNRRQLGIDISDVLGKRSFDTDDYADYKFDDSFYGRHQSSWGSESFQKRKNNLLEYIELDVQELNILMDHKDSVYSTGVSQYLPRINKPFKDFGAIFRLEGVLVDITSLQLKAWTKVAEKYKFKQPQLEDVQRASVTRPEIAVQDIFGWSNNFLECREIAALHKEIFREFFKEWATENGVTASSSSKFIDEPSGYMALGQEIVEDNKSSMADKVKLPLNEAERITTLSRAWERTAKAFGKDFPTRDEIVLAANLSPDIAVVEIFKWTEDPLEADDIARQYRSNLKVAMTGMDSVSKTASSTLQSPLTHPKKDSARALTKNDVMEIHYQAWSSVAALYNFKPPTSDEVLAAFVINDPETAIQGFGWTEDQNEIKNIARSFQTTLNGLLQNGQGTLPSESKENVQTAQTSHPAKTQPTPDEVFQLAFDTWEATAKRAGLPGPDPEVVQFALTVGLEEAITVGFGWADAADKEGVAKFLNMYQEELAKRQPSWRINKLSPPSETRNAYTSVPRDSAGPSMDDLFKIASKAWTVTAEKLNLPVPDDEQVQFALTVGPEEAVATGFGWTDNPDQIQRVVAIYKDEVGKLRKNLKTHAPANVLQDAEKTEASPTIRIIDGGVKWISSLLNVEMQCGIVSYLEREQVDILMEQAGLADLIPPSRRVSSSNGYVTDKDQILGVALRLERRPDHCALFDTSPYASVAAHDVEMRSVSLIGPFPRYELLSADMTTSSFEDLTAMNIRRLFGERVYDQPLADSQQIQPESRRRTKIKYFFDDE